MAEKASDDDCRAQQIHDYWFGPCDDWQQVMRNNARRWFENGQQLDTEIRQLFSDTLASARHAELNGWQDNPLGSIALVLLLDQFPRHIFRGQAQAFASDGQALSVCLEGIERGIDAALHPVQQAFYYLPLEHAEDIAMHDRHVEVLQQRLAQAAPEFKNYLANTLEYASQHRNIICRFGRYPHRNQVLGRVSTPQELAYLDAGAARFGQ